MSLLGSSCGGWVGGKPNLVIRDELIKNNNSLVNMPHDKRLMSLGKELMWNQTNVKEKCGRFVFQEIIDKRRLNNSSIKWILF